MDECGSKTVPQHFHEFVCDEWQQLIQVCDSTTFDAN